MDEDNDDEKAGLFDITQYSERTRKIVFGVFVGILLVIIGIAMFFISPKNDENLQAANNDNIEATQAPVDGTQAPVDDETSEPEPSNSSEKPDGPSLREEAITPEEDISLEAGELPKSAEEEAEKAQAKIIEESLKRKKEQADKVVEDFHPTIKNSPKLKEIASKGMLAYCTDKAGETEDEKQARMKPYFHAENSEYKEPSSLYYVTKCSVEAVTDPSHDENEDIVVNVGIAWGAQLEKDGAASTGYTQYSVVLDENGIINFND